MEITDRGYHSESAGQTAGEGLFNGRLSHEQSFLGRPLARLFVQNAPKNHQQPQESRPSEPGPRKARFAPVWMGALSRTAISHHGASEKLRVRCVQEKTNRETGVVLSQE